MAPGWLQAEHFWGRGWDNRQYPAFGLTSFFFFIFKSNHVSSLKYNGNMLKSRFKYDLTKDNSQL